VEQEKSDLQAALEEVEASVWSGIPHLEVQENRIEKEATLVHPDGALPTRKHLVSIGRASSHPWS
jgi:gamma-glutamylcysteine synthetase